MAWAPKKIPYGSVVNSKARCPRQGLGWQRQRRQSWGKRGAGRGTRNSKDVHSQPEIGSRQWRSTELPVAQVVTELQKNCTQWRISQANPRRPCQFARAQGKVRKLLLCLRPGQKSVRPLRKSSSICAAAVRSAAPHPCWVAHSSGPSVGNCVTAALSDRRGFAYLLA